MSEAFNSNHNLRFFSNASILKNKKEQVAKSTQDPVPFGLQFQEKFPTNVENITRGPSHTNTSIGPDTCIDIDIEV